MKRRFVILFAALVSVSGASACGGVQEELQKRAQDEVKKGRQQVEQKVQTVFSFEGAPSGTSLGE